MDTKSQTAIRVADGVVRYLRGDVVSERILARLTQPGGMEVETVHVWLDGQTVTVWEGNDDPARERLVLREVAR